MVGRLLTGIGMGMDTSVHTMYVCELSSTAWRSFLAGSAVMCIMFGIFLIYVIGTVANYDVSIIVTFSEKDLHSYRFRFPDSRGVSGRYARCGVLSDFLGSRIAGVVVAAWQEEGRSQVCPENGTKRGRVGERGRGEARWRG